MAAFMASLQSLNIAFITAAIIVVTIFLFITNDMIFILFIIKNQIIMHGSEKFGAYGLYACRKSLFFIRDRMVITLHF